MVPPDRTVECAFANLRRASRAVGHLYDLVLAPTQLKVTQFTMLRSIAVAGEIAHCDLARQSVGSEETFSRRLAGARRSGWVSMRIGERQRRVYRLTDKGEQVLREAMPYWQRAQDRMRRELGDEDWKMLLMLAGRVADAALRAETAPRKNTWPPAHPVPNPLALIGNEKATEQASGNGVQLSHIAA
ncbi:MAG TPA: MarR family winged helix-turn-helix transcriptional regulator [Acidobacteriaceae bacterium]|nr:MarR family winged helix-turn-helix transcriptional regulator [Acidobacteriaceae bacterium]